MGVLVNKKLLAWCRDCIPFQSWKFGDVTFLEGKYRWMFQLNNPTPTTSPTHPHTHVRVALVSHACMTALLPARHRGRPPASHVESKPAVSQISVSRVTLTIMGVSAKKYAGGGALSEWAYKQNRRKFPLPSEPSDIWQAKKQKNINEQTKLNQKHNQKIWLQLVIPKVRYSEGSVNPKVRFSEGSLFRRFVNPKMK